MVSGFFPSLGPSTEIVYGNRLSITVGLYNVKGSFYSILPFIREVLWTFQTFTICGTVNIKTYLHSRSHVCGMYFEVQRKSLYQTTLRKTLNRNP